MSDGKAAEQLWLKAHEEVRKGNLAQAVRDLAKCYEMLKALQDPRLAQVHRRWVEVHKLYQARKAKAAAQPGAAEAAARAAAQAQAAEAERQRAEAEARARAEAEAREREEALRAEARSQQEEARTLEQRAEAAANGGDLAGAVRLYEDIVTAQPGNELARERLDELRAATQHAQSYSQAARGGGSPDDQVAFLEGLLGRIQERRRAV